MKNRYLNLFIISIFLLNSFSCVPSYKSRLTRTLSDPTQKQPVDSQSPFLKAHMIDGQVYVLQDWTVDEENRTVTGKGTCYDPNRTKTASGNFTLPVSDVALFETNVIQKSPVIAPMAIITGASLALTGLCIINPKACFGSCPTFYAWDGEKMTLQAEGFSSSVSPALEKRDLDALYRTKPRSQNFQLRVTNEALETHVIRSANLKAIQRSENGRIFASPSGDYWQAHKIIAPKTCTAPEGDRLADIKSFDGIERFSAAHPKNLAAKETIDLEFESFSGQKLGLVVGFRQTLLTTYLFYQGLAYMGSQSGYWLAKLERGGAQAKKYLGNLNQVLGSMEIQIKGTNGRWVLAGKINEIGPISTDVQIVPLPKTEANPLKLRIRMTQGLWRIDYLALAELGRKIEPIQIEPHFVLKEGIHDEPTLKKLLDPAEFIFTLPGDELILGYNLPSDFTNYELFIESQGYYLEWMRPSWLKEENPRMALKMFTRPKKILKILAQEFKKIEPQMEDTFWRSKYVRK